MMLGCNTSFPNAKIGNLSKKSKYNYWNKKRKKSYNEEGML